MAVHKIGLNSGYELHLITSVNTQSVDTNQTWLHVEFKIVKTNTSIWHASSYSNSWNANINGTTYSGTFTYNFNGVTEKLLLATDQWIQHNSDGTKTITSTGSVSTSNIGSGTVSGNDTLPAIPRTSTFTLSQSHTEAGSSVTITIAKASTNFRHDIEVFFGTRQAYVAANVDTSYTWTIPMEYLDQIPNLERGFGTIRVHTKTGGAGSPGIGYRDTAFAIVAGDSAKPTLTSLTIAEATTAHPGPAGAVNIATTIGAYVQNISKAKVTMNGVGALHGATVKVRTVTVGSEVISAPSGVATSSPLPASGTITITAYVEDSRGLSNSISTTITVLAYQPPRFVSPPTPTVRRASSSTGTLAVDTGIYARFDVTTAIQSLMVGTEKNTGTYVLLSRAAGSGAAYTQDKTAARALNTSSAIIVGTATVPVDSSRDYRLEIRDRLATSYVDLQLPSGGVFMHWDGKLGAGFGKYRTNGGTTPASFVLDVLGQIFQNNGKTVLDDGMLATQAEAEAGTDNIKWTSPLRTAQYVSKILGSLLGVKIAFGVATTGGASVAVAGNTNTTVTFPAGRFTVAPTVIATNTSGRFNCAINSVTAASAVIQSQNNSNGAGPVGNIHWIAISL